jgi:hypothetical protein
MRRAETVSSVHGSTVVRRVEYKQKVRLITVIVILLSVVVWMDLFCVPYVGSAIS